ncbi:hypothetical protein [Sphingomonas sp. GC_Shp_1]|uniref:hypothetical protein n=2 Tax=unclassified Sphingomonas TaxID=196159 RepID=UPI00226B26C6|nr:hypothetical protein [Sphingomonas sp. GC_Shp_1]
MIAVGVFWFLFAIAAIMPLRWSVVMLFAALPFGSMTVVPGSITILPYVALSPLVVAKVLMTTHNPTALWDGMFNWRRLGLLTAFMVVAMFVTYSAPFLFPGARVMGLSTLRPMPLGFGGGNITQPLYLAMSYLLCIALYLLMLTPTGPATIAVALLTGASMSVLSGLLDMATAGTTALAPLRTATYAILETAEVANTRRVIGFNTEASTFGALTLSFGAILIFMSPTAWLGGRAKLYERALILIVLAMSVLSTSSSAYLGLVLLALLYLIRLALLVVTPRNGLDRRQSTLSILALMMTLLLATTYLVVRPAVLNGAIEIVDNTLVKKSGSDSADERASWNRVSMEGFSASGGYGVGVGSTRTSSWIVAVISSTGVLGALLLLAFLARGFLAYLAHTDARMRYAAIGARYAFLIILVPASVAGTLVDFGVFNALLFAVMAAAPKVLSLSRPAVPAPAARGRLRRRAPLPTAPASTPAS